MNSTDHSIVNDSIRNIFQNITSHIEDFLELIDIELNVNLNSVSILSVSKKNSTDSYSQLKLSNGSFSYSTEKDHPNATTTITIDQNSITNLSETDIYTFYYLPSSIFQYAQIDKDRIIVSSIVGIHLPNKHPRSINMSFLIDTDYGLGRYSCGFWSLNRWNDTGCLHSQDLKSNRHFCRCTHTTSFALIFIPGKTIPELYIPSIIISILSIVCFSISIILSIHRRVISFRHLSKVNIFTLSNSIILFILLTAIFIHGHQISGGQSKFVAEKCSVSSRNLSIATYFFLLSTFASKTFLGICYFLTIFFHFVFIRLTSLSNKWFYLGIFLVILITIIPIIIINVILHQWKDLFLQYDGICWFNSSVIFKVVSIPMIIFIGLNVVIILAITLRLIHFCIGRKTTEQREKRMIISLMIWLSLCISLGVGWILGPFLDMATEEKKRLSPIVIQSIFGFFIGLEGVWVLIVNVIFYLNQKMNLKNREKFSMNLNQYRF